MAVIDFKAAAVEMPQIRCEINSGGIHQGLFGEIERGTHREQFAADRTHPRVEIARIDQRLNEALQQQDVRIQRQHPLGAGKTDRLILSRRETDILLVVDDCAPVFKRLQNIDGSVRRIIIDYDNFFIRIFLLKNRFDASLDEAATVVSDDSYRYEFAARHVRAGRLHFSDFALLTSDNTYPNASP